MWSWNKKEDGIMLWNNKKEAVISNARNITETVESPAVPL